MYVLGDLWRGKLSPSEKCVNADSEFSELSRKLRQTERLLSAEMSEKGRQLFQEYQATQEKMSSISEEDVFINAFRIGVGMILDAVGTYDSQFCRFREE